MTPLDRRRLLAEAVIALSICAGAHYFVVEPISRRHAAAHAKVEQLVRRAEEIRQLSSDLPRVETILADSSARARAIENRGRLARDEGAFFAAMMSLAAEHSIRIDNLQPSRWYPATPPAPGAAAHRPGDAAIACSIAAGSSYADLAQFLRAIQSDLGYTSIRRVRITPSPDGMVFASIDTSHYAFDATPLSLADGATP